MKFDLAGKVAVVTGSSRGIGAAIAKALADQGAKLVINHRHSPEGATVVAEAIKANGGEVTIIQADVGQSNEAQRLIKGTIDT